MWEDWHFSDEFHIEHNARGTEYVIRLPSEQNCGDCMQKKLKRDKAEGHCWAMIGYNYKSKLVFYDMDEMNPIDAVSRTKSNPLGRAKGKKGGNITQEAYVKLILPHFEARKRELDAKGRRFIFQEDNDKGPGHMSNLENPARMAKDEMDLDYIENWPPQSPDLNPIENVWRILKQRVKGRKPTSKEELKRMLLEEWENISYEEINELT